MRSGEALRTGESDNLFSYLHINLTDQALVPPGTKLRGLGGEQDRCPQSNKEPFFDCSWKGCWQKRRMYMSLVTKGQD